MKIIRCYIQNFGKLHEFNYEFSDGLNVLNEVNGWGKSTLATFIKVMFYGFDNSNKRAIDENERKKYYPWQGGKFGGTLEIEIDNKVYEIERFFGIKEKEDTFKLYNKSTNCESLDYSENIGEEIFKIDRQAYERSTYIPQNNISVEINDSLSSKLSNILENENDINTSEDAINRITLAMKEYKKIGNKGKINELENKIFIKNRELEQSRKNEELINERNKKIENLSNTIKLYKNELDNNQAKINLNAENEKNKIKKDRYDELCEIIKKDESEISEIKKYFNNIIPENEEIKRYENISFNIDSLIAKLDELIIEDEEAEKYEELKRKFYGKEITDKEINDNYLIYSEIENTNKEITAFNERLNELKNKQREIIEKNKKKNEKIIIYLLLVISGIVLGIFASKYLYSISLIGVVGIIFNLIKKEKNEKENIEKLNKVINEKNKTLKELKEKIYDFVSLYDNNIDEASINYEYINRINNEYYEYKNMEKIIREKEIKGNEYKSNIEKLIYEINLYLNRYCPENISKDNIIEFNNNCKNIIENIKTKKIEYEKLINKLKEDELYKNNYEKENDIANLKVIEIEEKNIQEIKDRNEQLSKKLNELINQKSYDENEMNRLINTMDNSEDIENEIEMLKNELLEANKKYDILNKTQKYLTRAKEEFSSHYLNGMINGFEKYINIINGEKIDTSVDVKLNVQIKEQGEKKEIAYLSTGYKDLIGICMRFALVDALYENEKPFIILDDPFVNLDQEKLTKAINLLNEISKKYQIIYFICHESRG